MEKIIPSNQVAWYAVYVKSRCEKKAHTELQSKNIESFLPLQRKLRQWSDRRKWVELPLIPGYLFVHIGRKEYDIVLQSLHVVNYVRFEGTAAVIPDYQIDYLSLMHKISNLNIEMTQEKFESGQMIEIIAGPLTGIKAKLICIKGKDRIAIELEQIGYSALIEISSKDIRISV